MSVKHYCDICGFEINRNYVNERISGRGYQPDGNNPLLIEIVVGSGRGVWNDGDVCRTCLRAAVLDAIDDDVSSNVVPAKDGEA